MALVTGIPSIKRDQIVKPSLGQGERGKRQERVRWKFSSLMSNESTDPS
jgi:hypothetical protein